MIYVRTKTLGVMFLLAVTTASIHSGWKDYLSLSCFKQNQFTRSLTEIACAVGINASIGYTIAITTHNDYFFLRQALALFCAPPIAKNLHLTPKLFEKLSLNPKTKKILAQITKYGACLGAWGAIGIPIDILTHSTDIGSFSMQILATALLLFIQDLTDFVDPKSSSTPPPAQIKQNNIIKDQDLENN